MRINKIREQFSIFLYLSHLYPAAVWPWGSLNVTHSSGEPCFHCHLSGSPHMAGEWVWSNSLVAGMIWQCLPVSLSDWRPWTTPDRGPLRSDAEQNETEEQNEKWKHFLLFPEYVFELTVLLSSLHFQPEEWPSAAHYSTHWSLKSLNTTSTKTPSKWICKVNHHFTSLKKTDINL